MGYNEFAVLRVREFFFFLSNEKRTSRVFGRLDEVAHDCVRFSEYKISLDEYGEFGIRIQRFKRLRLIVAFVDVDDDEFGFSFEKRCGPEDCATRLT